MADLHIDDFYKDVARIFAHLYASFPRKIILFVEDISGPDAPDEFGLHCPRFQSCFSTMVWLANAGHIAFETTIRQEALDQAVLTHKGFNLLTSRINLQETDGFAGEAAANTSPSPSSNYVTAIYLVRQALKSGSSNAIEQVVRELLRTSLASR